MTAREGDFDLRALHEALDAERRARGMTWTQVAREIDDPLRGIPTRPVSRSTIAALGTRSVAEGDGVLQMLRWLGRTPESFVRGGPGPRAPAEALPTVPPDTILRFDTSAIHAALVAAREARGLTWGEVAREVGGVTAGSLRRYARGGRTGFPGVERIARWLGVTVASLTRASPR